MVPAESNAKDPERRLIPRYFKLDTKRSETAELATSLPLKQPLEWGSVNGRPLVKELDKSHNVLAALVYSRGTVRSAPCKKCKDHNGSFEQCIIKDHSLSMLGRTMYYHILVDNRCRGAA